MWELEKRKTESGAGNGNFGWQKNKLAKEITKLRNSRPAFPF